MRFTANITTIQKLLKDMRACDDKAIMPCLREVLLRVNPNGGFDLSSTNLDVWITRAADTESVQAGGALSVNRKALQKALDAAASVGAKTVAISSSEKDFKLTLLAGDFNQRLFYRPASEFPQQPAVKCPKEAFIGAHALRAVLTPVAYAQCMDDTRRSLAGTNLSINHECLQAVATDGHRLARAIGEQLTGTFLASTLPYAATNVLIDLLKGAGEDVLTVQTSPDAQFSVASDKLYFYCRTQEAAFPDTSYVMTEKKHATTTFKVKTETALATLKPFVKANHVDVHVYPKGDVKLFWKCEQPADDIDMTMAVKKDVEADGKDIEVRYSPAYLCEALQSLGVQTVEAFIIDKLSPIRFDGITADGVECTAIIMPMAK